MASSSSRCLPQRRHPAHFAPAESDDRPIIVFVTVCTHRRQPALATPETHAYLRGIWQAACGWKVGRYLLMPDHVHLFCGPARLPAPPLTRWVEYWKSRSAAAWPGGCRGKLWQRDAWDTQLRTGESYREKWHYVRENPVRAKLVNSSDEWPFQGELNVLRWHR